MSRRTRNANSLPDSIIEDVSLGHSQPPLAESPPSSKRRDKPPKLDPRAAAMLETLDRARNVVEIEGSRLDPFGRLALGILEKELEGVLRALGIIRVAWRESQAKPLDEPAQTKEARSAPSKTRTDAKEHVGVDGSAMPPFRASAVDSHRADKTVTLSDSETVSLEENRRSSESSFHRKDDTATHPRHSAHPQRPAKLSHNHSFSSHSGHDESNRRSGRDDANTSRPQKQHSEDDDDDHHHHHHHVQSHFHEHDFQHEAIFVVSPPLAFREEQFATLTEIDDEDDEASKPTTTDYHTSNNHQNQSEEQHFSSSSCQSSLQPADSPVSSSKPATPPIVPSTLPPLAPSRAPSRSPSLVQRTSSEIASEYSHNHRPFKHHEEAMPNRSRRRPQPRGGAAVVSSDLDSSEDDHRAKGKTTDGSSGNSEAIRQALLSASAPPPEPSTNVPLVFDEPAVLRRIAEELAYGRDNRTLATLSLVSSKVHAIVTPVLYRTFELKSLRQAQALEFNSQHSSIREMRILPLDGGSMKVAVAELVEGLKPLLGLCTGLEALDEDFTSDDWDVRTVADHPLVGHLPHLARFTSRRSWWEISALCELLGTLPLESLVFGGAVMDREWEGQRILAGPPAILFPRLRSLEIAQVAHEDTLEVLLRSCGKELRSLRIGFQSIGTTDEDTPRSRISPALAHVASTLQHLALRAPLQASDTASGLVDECVALLPRLEILEFSEQGEILPVPIATPELLSRLPPTLRTLRARGLVSISSTEVLALLAKPEGIPVLEQIDIVWSLDDKSAWKERHKVRLESTCESLGIRCKVERSDEPLVFREPELLS